jgi:hypothetical protein
MSSERLLPEVRMAMTSAIQVRSGCAYSSSASQTGGMRTLSLETVPAGGYRRARDNGRAAGQPVRNESRMSQRMSGTPVLGRLLEPG